ncbi:BadF/BadG/BcrA/BcrD ATPase family protein [Microbulbifer hainanensis]|uniref:BadF/BadG/BcrA/BcrD ATPase family protein n=1 Tax=Microbulbifer hainanensis TaxID=2735675 RepID=UPI001867E4B3|nr:BadF/BadG/BcrA/BcrD ATPase family protein [Microbulbifer hainanensis]
MSHCYIGIDGGGTKTLARLVDDNRPPIELRAGPSSLSQNLPQAISNIGSLCSQLLAASGVSADRVALACGVAGAGNESAARTLCGHLEAMGFAAVTVTSDARTSLVGAGAGLPMVMAAIGTGSVAMRLDRNGEIRQFGGWGLAVGDEGSGAAIGKSAVRALLWELDIHGAPQTPLSQQVMHHVGNHRPAILHWLQQAGSREYAAIAPMVFEHQRTCPLARDIAGKTVAEVERLIRSAWADTDLPITLLGGLADKLVPYLAEDLQSRLIPPLGSSLDGACILARDSVAIESTAY